MLMDRRASARLTRIAIDKVLEITIDHVKQGERLHHCSGITRRYLAIDGRDVSRGR
jgi:hypothetical protein